jgi:hypothetical protein
MINTLELFTHASLSGYMTQEELQLVQRSLHSRFSTEEERRCMGRLLHGLRRGHIQIID